MDTRTFRPILLLLALCAAAPFRVAFAATRVLSVYVESYAALQNQLFKGAEVFESPQLGALPMMLTMSLPGAAHINPQMPVALHLFDTGGGKAGFVMEVSPAGTPDAYLQAVLGRAPAADPAPANGIHRFDGGAARVSGGRVQISPSADDLTACAGAVGAALPDMPGGIQGTVRVVLFPGALKPWLANVRKPLAAMSRSGDPNAAQAQQSLTAVFDFYETILEQMAWLQFGLAIREDGLAFHTRMAPAKGSDLAAVAASVKPVAPGHLAFLAQEDHIGFASGSYTLPPGLRNLLVTFYTNLVSQAQAGAGEARPADLSPLFAASLRTLGAPLAVTANLTTNALLAQGAIVMDDAAGYLNEQAALMKTPAFQSMLAQSGMSMNVIGTRTNKTTVIHRYQTRFDEAAFKQAIRARLPSDATPEEAAAATAEGTAPLRTVARLLGGYEYAAVGGSLAFGMGAPAMIEQAIDRIGAPPQPAAEAARIHKALALPAAPCAIGRLSLSGLARVALQFVPNLPPDAAAALPKGDAILFGEWISGGEAHALTLVPPAEVKALKAAVQTVVKSFQSSVPDEAFDADEGEDEDEAPAAEPQK